MPRVRMIVNTYNQASLLALTLRSYLRQTDTDFSLCVADDGSSDETDQVVASFRDEAEALGIAVEHVWHEDDGFRRTVILNEAVRTAGSESLYVFSDADCLVPAHFVERHAKAHRPMSFHVGGVAWLSESQTKELTREKIDAGLFESWVSDASRRDIRKKRRQSAIGMALRKPNRPKIQGANMGFGRELFHALNGFDETYRAWGYEDSDIRSRAMSLRPRPAVMNLYGVNDVFHLHPLWRRESANRTVNREYYRSKKPARCVRGLLQGDPGEPVSS